MSLDVSHPALTAARQAIADPSDPTTWFLLTYSPTAQPQVVPLASGPLPVLPAWQTHLEETDQGVLFGYAEIADKGLVLLYLRPDVGGVKRARAIVHSRAIASMYPEYSAIITIADPEELTEELVAERLGLGVPAPVEKEKEKARVEIPAETGSPSRANFSERRKPPPQLSALGLGTPPEPAAVAVPSVEQLKEQDDRNRKPSFTSRLKHTFHRSSPSIEDTPTPTSFSSPSTPASTSSPSNTDKPTPRTPTSPTNPGSPSMGMGMGMGSGRFKAGSLGKVFGKKTATSTSPATTSPSLANPNGFDQLDQPPRPISHDFSPSIDHGPALPPKDSSPSPSPLAPTPTPAPSAPSLHAAHGHSPYPTATPPLLAPPVPAPLVSRDSQTSAASQYHTPLGSPSASPSEEIVPNARSTSLLTPTPLLTPEPAPGGKAGLSPSPSARQVLYDARQKSLDREREIQERFRRDLSEKDAPPGGYVNGQGGGQGQGGGYESSTRLAYDTDTDTEDERVKPTPGERVVVAVPSLDALPVSPVAVDDVPGGAGGATSPGLVGLMGRGAFPSPPPFNGIGRGLPELEPGAETETRETHELEEAQQQAMMRHEMSALHTEQQAEEEVAREAQDPAERQVAEEKARVDGEIEERLRVEYEERVRREREREREREEEEEEERVRREREEEQRERRREVEEEERRLAEEERLRIVAEEEERQRLEEEERVEAERQRLEEEERQRLEEEERARVQAEQERKRVEEEALAAKKRAEEEAEKQKIEVELAKKQAIRDGLLSGKRDGGVMLRGWVTAQTYKSMTWRRRHFQLLPTEMRLFKNESDAKPMQTIFFGPSTTISEAYEESQVKDSFKLVSSAPGKGDEEFFLFTDSAEDKEVVLEGIRLCI
ncbi:hypothetical protein B9479_007777 [Cryptococcus floricola]|uniref:PH domain-containing protein n=1 Tax=Cryptococcus floricola TaxID=2591691 RepID=A0A5D3ANI7_9TREE|nr:hypothetical protein B9479_007777 [Cryptococcus floricola]